MKLDIKFVSPAAARMYGEDGPTYAKLGDCAFDLRACVEHTITILTGEQVLIPTGIAIDLESLRDANTPDFIRYAAIALPRSGLGSKEGLVLGNTIGLMDQGYQGELLICAWARPTSGYVNLVNGRMSSKAIHIEPGQRIAQLVIAPVLHVGFNVVDQFKEPSERGADGFGSSGHN